MLRDAKWQLTVDNADLQISQLVYAIVGDHVVSDRPEAVREPGGEKLSLSEVSVGHRLKDFRLSARAGQVTAVLGPAGDGQSLIFEILSGRLRPDGGSMRVNEESVRLVSVRASLRSGLRCVPGNRLGYGLVGGLSIDENIVMARDSADKRKFISWKDLHSRAAELRERFGVKSINANPNS